MIPMKLQNVLLSTLAAIGLPSVFAASADDPFAWPPITAQQKPWAFNWWMGSAVDKTNLTKELERYAAAGLGGIHIIPIYGAKGFEDKYINYLSPQWMEMMGWAVSEANRLGMGVDMTTGSGWCFGGPQVTDADANANVVVKISHAEKGKPWGGSIDLKSVQAVIAVFADGTSKDLTAPMTNPLYDWYWTPPTNGCDIYVISQKPSGQKVKRAGPGGEGWMLNLLHPPAMDTFLKPYTAAFTAYTGPKPRAQYHDSYEYKSDWSPSFFAEFEKRRGYRLQTELPSLFSKEDNDHANRVKCDYRQTVSEIMAEESLPKWVNWSHERGFLTRNQAHGSPGNWLDLYATADIPETEMFHTDRNKLISKFASSAAHVTGKPLVSAETGTWLEEHFTEKLADVKHLMDDMFLSGVNHMFYHGVCYSPDEAGWPGWHFYASLEMNPRNSIWRDAPALNAYAARCQSILQSGQPDNDILLYWNTADFWMQPGDKLLPQLTVHARDWFEGQPIGRTAKELWDKGCSFDYVSDVQLKVSKATDSMVHTPGGWFKYVVVPECKYIPLETLKQLCRLAEEGALVIFWNKLPDDVSGGGALGKQREEFAQLAGKIKSQLKDSWTTWGKGTIAVSSLANGLSLPHESAALAGLSFVRRWVESEGWNYFIANRGQAAVDRWIELGCVCKSVVILDPMSGRSGVAGVVMYPPPGTSGSAATDAQERVGQVHLKLQAGESVILRCFSNKKAEGPAWTYWQTNGQPVEITGDWKVKFISGGPTLPADFQTAKLASWTTFPDTNTQAFGGTAKYTLEFNLQVAPDTLKRELQHYSLDLGKVCQSARVRVNGKDYGTLITPPFRVVVDNLKPAGNTLEVEVTSTDANRIRDLDRRGVPWKNFRDINFVDINYKPFDASKWPLTDCGLLGPVTLAPVNAGR